MAPLKFTATVVWLPTDTNLYLHDLDVTAVNYMGTIAPSYSHTEDTVNDKGDFKGIGFPEARVPFTPDVATATQVDAVLTASANVLGFPPSATSSSTTVTYYAP